jgi:hypothetical protein
MEVRFLQVGLNEGHVVMERCVKTRREKMTEEVRRLLSEVYPIEDETDDDLGICRGCGENLLADGTCPECEG